MASALCLILPLAACGSAPSPEEAERQPAVAMRAGHYAVVLEGSDFERGGGDVHNREACLTGDPEYFPRRLAKIGFLDLPVCGMPSTNRIGNRLTGRQICTDETAKGRKTVTPHIDAVIGAESLDGVFRVTDQSNPAAMSEDERKGMEGMKAARPTITARRTGDCAD